MSGSESVKRDSAVTPAAPEAQSEIDDILNEVEAIRRELNGEPRVTSSVPGGATASGGAHSEPRLGSGSHEPKSTKKNAVPDGKVAGNGKIEKAEGDEEDSELLKEFRKSFIKTDVSEDLDDFDGLSGAEKGAPVAQAAKGRGSPQTSRETGSADEGRGDEGRDDEGPDDDAGMEDTLSALAVDESLSVLDNLPTSAGDSEQDEGGEFPSRTLAHGGGSSDDESEAMMDSDGHNPGEASAVEDSMPEEAAGAGGGALDGGAGASPGALTMILSGRMTLKLKYDFEGQEVMVSFADGCLKVELADGAEFKIPVGQVKRIRKPARRAA